MSDIAVELEDQPFLLSEKYFNSHVFLQPTKEGWIPVLKYFKDDEFVSVPGMASIPDRNFAVRQAQSWARAIGVRCLAS